MEEGLNQYWQQVVEEERLLALKVASAIDGASRRKPVRSNVEDFQALREEAAGASEGDLPALIDQLHNMQSQARAIKQRMLPNRDEPYFAHMTLESNGRSREVLLGYHSFIEPKYGVTIIDWRHAPVAGVFFEYQEGEIYEQEAGDRELTGRLVNRRIVAFQEGALVQVITPKGTAWRERDGSWRYQAGSVVPSLEGGAGGSLAEQIIGTGQSGRKLPRVSALLDARQHEAIHCEDDKALLIKGGAGCGKTTVALHRLAYLNHTDENKYHPNRMAVVVPEPGLKSLVRHLLDELSMDPIEVNTYDDWIWKQARRVFPSLRKKTLYKDTPPAVVRFKRHPAMRDVLEKYAHDLVETVATRLDRKLPLYSDVGKVFRESASSNLLQRLDTTEKKVIENFNRSEAERPAAFDAENGYFIQQIRSAFKTERRRLNNPDEDRLDVFGDEGLLQEAVRNSNGTLTDSMVKSVLRHTKAQFSATADKKYSHIEASAMETVDGRSLDEGTPDETAGTMDVEDLALLFQLHRLKTGRLSTPMGRPKKSVHMVVDEAQDLAPVELNLLGRTIRTNSHMTVAGDHSQQIDPAACFVTWDDTMQELGQKIHDNVELTVSYRCTRPIAEFSFDILGQLKPVTKMNAPKDGAPVLFSCFATSGQRGLLLTEALADLFNREPKANAAVIAATEETAKALHEVIIRRMEARLVLDGLFEFAPGLDVTHIDQIKGLEFDYVIIPDASIEVYPDKPEARRRLHVATSRAIHQLWVICVGNPSPIISPLLESNTDYIREVSALQIKAK